MGTSSMLEYIQSIKPIMDNLVAVANPVADSDLVSILLTGLSVMVPDFSHRVNFNPIQLY